VPGALNGLGNLDGLSGFSKIRKMIFLTALGAGFAASKFYVSKFEVALTLGDLKKVCQHLIECGYRCG